MPGTAQDAPSQYFKGTKLLPYYPHGNCTARTVAGNFAPNLVIPQGTALTLTVAAANDVQSISITGTPTGGTFQLVVPYDGYTLTSGLIKYNATAGGSETGNGTSATPYVSVLGALLALLGAGNVTTSGGALPGTAVAVTFAGKFAGQPMTPMTANISGLTGGTPVFANTHTTTGAIANTYAKYAGSGNCVGFSEYDVATDAAGNVSFGLQAGSQFGVTYLSAPVYINGDFLLSDLSGVDANAVTTLGARMIIGSLSAGGVLHIP